MDAADEGEALQGARAWRAALAAMLMDPGPELALYSPAYADWPFDDAAVMAALHAWALPRRQPRVRMLARSFDEAQVRYPRLVRWRTEFAHVIECRVLDEHDSEPREGLLLRDRGIVARDGDAWRRASRCEGAALHAAAELFDAAWNGATPGFPTFALGL